MTSNTDFQRLWALACALMTFYSHRPLRLQEREETYIKLLLALGPACIRLFPISEDAMLPHIHAKPDHELVIY